ncbi:hypothetical protein [Paraclostridium bifermentans]|uniref:hypothetical protein n=1 Tax=Paraclostridium bifermentans TaxID=1490 RepID=UPI001C805E04|nr:hypothetical protein [Paraclostridium bifermentans]GIM31033.1 hypothetical protein PAGU1678_03030 [Paraclostridium bifermentans subsp. muricolitidis]
MIKKLLIIVLVSIFITPFYSKITFAEDIYYPKVENLQGKEQLITELEELKRIRENMSTINIKADLYFSEQIQFIADSYIISLRQQQNLLKQLDANNPDAKKLFESDYLTPAYYYVTLGDQMYSYIIDYFSIL